MRFSSSVRLVVALAGAVLIVACNAGSGSQTVLDLRDMVHSHVTANTAFERLNAVHPDRRASWISPDAKKAPRLLFVSDDSTDDVYIFTMPAMALKGTLTGFAQPQGMCTDGSGNVWIANSGTSQVLQYSRTGTRLRAIGIAEMLPVGCAVNKTNGDLAVTNLVSTIGGSGNVEIFPPGSSSGTPLENPDQNSYYFPAYDPAGNLYVDGFTSYNVPIFSKCAAGSGSCSTLSLSGGTIFFPGGLNWDRIHNQLLAGDQSCNSEASSCLYAMTISGSAATIVGSTPLSDYDGGACDVDQGTLAPLSKYFAGPCISKGSASSAAARWPYFTGGKPTNYTTTPAFPLGTAISDR